MKKLLGSTLALAMFLPTGANAELLKNLKVSGQLDVQTTSARNVADFLTRDSNDRIGDAHTRTMLSADWDLLDDVHARVTLEKGAGTARVYGEGSESLDNIQTNTNVEEANVKIDKLAGLFDTTVGRQFYGEAGDLIVYFGPRDSFGQSVTAIDAFRFDWKGENVAVTGLAGRTADTDNLGLGLPGGNGDVDLRGIVASFSESEMVKPSVYVYNRVTHRNGGIGAADLKNDNLYVFGVKAKVTTGGLNAHVEVAANRGENRNGTGVDDASYNGYAFLGKLGYKADVADVAAVHPWAEFGLGSGDANFSHAGNKNFQSIATDYRPGGIYGRFDANNSAVALAGGDASNGLTNRVIWGFGVKATPAAVNKLTAGLGYYRYAYHRVAPVNGVKPSRNIGSEVDVTAEWKHSDNVGLNVTLGSFLPGARLNDLAATLPQGINPAQMAAADLKIRF